jgi:hypothetical protein
LPFFAAVRAVRGYVEPTWWHAVATFETAGEISRRTKSGGKGDLGKGQVPLRFPSFARHHRECALQSDTFDEFVQGFADERAKDAMKMKRRKASDTCDLFEPDRPIHIVQDEIDRAIDAVGIIQRLRFILWR